MGNQTEARNSIKWEANASLDANFLHYWFLQRKVTKTMSSYYKVNCLSVISGETPLSGRCLLS